MKLLRTVSLQNSFRLLILSYITEGKWTHLLSTQIIFFVKIVNPLSASVALTSQLIWTVNQLAGFYMRATLALNELTAFRKTKFMN